MLPKVIRKSILIVKQCVAPDALGEGSPMLYIERKLLARLLGLSHFQSITNQQQDVT
jgi:hypothetical protein